MRRARERNCDERQPVIAVNAGENGARDLLASACACAVRSGKTEKCPQ